VSIEKRLIIAEKPDMGKKIASALAKPHKFGNGHIVTGEGVVTWCIGHILKALDAKEYRPEWGSWKFENLPMLLDDLKLKVDDKKASQFKVIKDLLKDCDEVINAGDPGREGQLIVDEVLTYLNNKKPVKRVLLYALDKQTVTEAFKNLKDNKEFYPLYLAGVCRGFADWGTGINGTVAFTLKAQENGYKGVLSVGRVQSPTLAIVVKRDEEIENFVSHEYFTLQGIFNYLNNNFTAYWKPSDTINPQFLDTEKRLIDKSTAENIANKIKNKPAIVKDYTETDGKESQPLPFNLSKLQIYANSKWGMTAKKVLDVCQSLYEHHELQTYPRTDCQYLPENQIGDADIILKNIAKAHSDLAKVANEADTSLKSHAWNDKRLGEHFGLIPTKKLANLNELSTDEKKIYKVVCERYIAQFYPECEFKSASLTLECEQETFKANGKTILKPGWKVIFLSNENEDGETKEKGDEEEQIFPNIKQGDKLLCSNSKLSQKKTSPPARYTEGSLIKAMTNVHTLVDNLEMKKKLMDKKGIGQEATRTGIIEALKDRKLLLVDGKKLISSEAARALIKVLPKKLIAPEMTAIWEDALDKISEGKMSAELFKEKQREWIKLLVDEAKKATIDKINSNQEVVKKSNDKSSVKPKGKTCPKCKEGTLVKKIASASKKEFLGCSCYPKCNYTEWPKK
jgi:DNA topoisomerase-3